MKIPVEMNIQQIKETILAFRGPRYVPNKPDLMLSNYMALTVTLSMNSYHHLLINERMNTAAHLKTAIASREIIDSVNKVWDAQIFVRISANDYHPDGLTVQIMFSIQSG